MMHRDKELTGSQVQKGVFMNAGSIDAGRDPNWNRDDTYIKHMQNRSWDTDRDDKE